MATFTLDSARSITLLNSSGTPFLKISEGDCPKVDRRIDGEKWINIQTFDVGGRVKAETDMRRDTFFSAISQLWPENVAYHFDEDDDEDQEF